jgi:hypothetical protein
LRARDGGQQRGGGKQGKVAARDHGFLRKFLKDQYDYVGYQGKQDFPFDVLIFLAIHDPLAKTIVSPGQETGYGRVSDR